MCGPMRCVRSINVFNPHIDSHSLLGPKILAVFSSIFAYFSRANFGVAMGVLAVLLLLPALVAVLVMAVRGETGGCVQWLP